MNKAHDVQVLSFNGPVMHLRVDGKDHEVDLARQSRRLANASQEQQEKYQISSVGYGIHWPDIDEDLSIDGLIGVIHHSLLFRMEV